MLSDPNAVDRRAQFLADWQAALNDTQALLREPDVYSAGLIEQAKTAYQQGWTSAEELREQLEWADAAQAWAVEELLTRELDQEGG